MNHWLKIKMQHLAKLSTPQQLAKAAPPNHSQDQMTQAICNVFKSCFNKKQRSFGKRSFTPFIFRVVRKVPKRKVPQQHHQHQHHLLHWFLLCKPSQRLWGWPSLCSASSGWDVRNNIDVKKNIHRSSEVFWLGTMILQKYLLNDLKWVLSVEFFRLLSCCERSKMVIQPTGRFWEKATISFWWLHNIHNFKPSQELISSQFPVSQNLRWAPSVGPAPCKGAYTRQN